VSSQRRRRTAHVLGGTLAALATTVALASPVTAAASAGSGVGDDGAAAEAARRPVDGDAASRTAAEFFAPRALAGIECGMYTDGVHCQSERSRPYLAQVAEIQPNGSVTFCSTRQPSANACDLGNAGERASTLAFGRHVTVGAFRCTMLRAGVRCTLLAGGKGFLLTRTKLTGVGGAKPRMAAQRLSDFLSPDRKVWCGIGEGRRPFCVAAQTGQGLGYPSASAEIEPDGKVKLCLIARESEAPLLHGSPQGCAQNWDATAPILAYGQSSELEGVRCTSATSGITCVVTSGASRGKGFRVSSSEAVEVSNASAGA
jgi:hypothetical protein